MATAGTKNQGMRFYIGTKAADASADTFTQIKRCNLAGEFGSEAPVIDATAFEDATRQKLKGIPDSGDMELGGRRVFADAGQTALEDAAVDTDDDPYNFRVEIPGAGSGGATPDLRFSFKALVPKFKTVAGAVDGLIEFASTLAITGAITDASIAAP